MSGIGKTLKKATKRLFNDRFNIPGLPKGGGIAAALSGIPGLQQQAMHSTDVGDMRAGASGTSSVGKENEAEAQAAAQAARESQKAAADEAARKQAEIDEKNAQEEEARRRLREAQGGGYAANILAGSGGLTRSGSAARRLSGS